MKQLATGVVIGLIFGLTISAMATSAFETGKSWQVAHSDYQLGYTIGAADMILNLEGPSDVDRIQTAKACLRRHAGDWNAGNLQTIVNAYLIAHPDALQYIMASDLLSAINGACNE